MKSKNSTNLRQVDGGKIIKQNDISSNFKFALKDEFDKKMDLNNVTATVALINQETQEVAYRTDVTVENGEVEFFITETLDVATYLVEIHVNGYVFPSKNNVTIEVTKSYLQKQEAKQTESTDVVTIDISELKKLKETFDNINIDDYADRLPEKAIENFNFYKNRITTQYSDLQLTFNFLLENIKDNIKDDVNTTMTSLELDYTEYKTVLSSFNVDELSDDKKTQIEWLGDPILSSQEALDEYVSQLKQILERNE